MTTHQGTTAPQEATSWQDRAKCREEDPELFFEGGGRTYLAKKICQACPVLTECLGVALSEDQRWGVWGGTTYEERRRIKRRGQARSSGPRRKKKDAKQQEGTS